MPDETLFNSFNIIPELFSEVKSTKEEKVDFEETVKAVQEKAEEIVRLQTLQTFKRICEERICEDSNVLFEKLESAKKNTSRLILSVEKEIYDLVYDYGFKAGHSKGFEEGFGQGADKSKGVF